MKWTLGIALLACGLALHAGAAGPDVVQDRVAGADSVRLSPPGIAAPALPRAGAVVGTPAPPQRELLVDGARLAYVERGQGPLVVLVHGALADHRGWLDVTEPLASAARVVSYTRRYHGPGPWPGNGTDYTWDRHVRDLVTLITALGAGPVHLVGHGDGAAIALLTALEHPDQVRSLALIEPGLTGFIVDRRRREAAGAERASADSLVRAAAEAGDAERGLRAFLAGMIGDSTAFDRLPEFRRSMMLDNARTLALDPGPPGGITCDALWRLRVPVLLVAGERAPTSFALADDGLARCIRRVERTTVRASGHVPHRDRPSAIGHVLLDFVSKFGPPSRRP